MRSYTQVRLALNNSQKKFFRKVPLKASSQAQPHRLILKLKVFRMLYHIMGGPTGLGHCRYRPCSVRAPMLNFG